ncbi:amidohydrolase family protein [uncultured Tateyamaria sp.]|uniref:amidohydrolase family protein n=1 Tax=uncultured Tateyamaria sp. TaxID=455651 RepID=UPI0026030E5F|nr:amidohydrolase family protein [uncultured Tateyamaria sp.]
MSDVLVPTALVADPARFGGTTVGDCLRGTPILRDGRLVALDSPAGDTAQMLIPHLIEPHCHLDKCHTIARLGQVGGDLRHAIARQTEDKGNWTETDLRTRARQGLSEAHANGCRAIRSHVDWGDTADPPLSWSVLNECAQDTPGLQLAALTGITAWADTEFAQAMGQTLAASQGVAGAFLLEHEQMQAGLDHIFDIATRHGLMLDFHVDEGLGAYNGLEAIADTARATGFEGPIMCGHAVSLMDRSPADFARIADKCARAQITICTLPVTNLYLQGRTDGTPDRRGITRLRELRDAGVRVVVGSDNVGDAFCPLGAHDPRAALALACVTAHLDPPLGDWLATITTDSAHAIGRAPVTVDGAQLSDLLTCDVTHTANLISGRTPLRPATETVS